MIGVKETAASKLIAMTLLPKGLKPWDPNKKPSVNLRTLAIRGMGTETKKTIKVGREMDYYDSKIGDKHIGKITKISSSGYEITDDKTGKKEKFTFYDKNKAQEVMSEQAKEC